MAGEQGTVRETTSAARPSTLKQSPKPPRLYASHVEPDVEQVPRAEEAAQGRGLGEVGGRGALGRQRRGWVGVGCRRGRRRIAGASGRRLPPFSSRSHQRMRMRRLRGGGGRRSRARGGTARPAAARPSAARRERPRTPPRAAAAPARGWGGGRAPGRRPGGGAWRGERGKRGECDRAAATQNSSLFSLSSLSSPFPERV